MLNKDKLFEMTQAAFDMLDKDQYPEAYGILKEVIENEDSPFIIASDLMECDKPKDLPAFMIEYTTALYEVEIANGNYHAMNIFAA